MNSCYFIIKGLDLIEFLAFLAPIFGLALALLASEYFKRLNDYYRLMAKLQKTKFPDESWGGYGPFFLKYIDFDGNEQTTYYVSKKDAEEALKFLKMNYGDAVSSVFIRKRSMYEWERW